MSKKSNREPDVLGFDPTEFYSNLLTLPAALKERMKAEGKDWRFIDANQFRADGQMHRSHWKPYIVAAEEDKRAFGANAEGVIMRKELILAVRDKAISRAHKDFVNKRNKAQNAYNKTQAQELKKAARDYGVDGETKIYEGYDEND